MDTKKLLLLLGCGGVFILMAACCGGNAWFTYGPYDFGVWKYCLKGQCVATEANTDKQKAIRAFSILAVLASVAAGGLALIGLFSDKIKGMLSSVFLIVSLVCMVIALSIFIDAVNDNPFNTASYGWSFYLGWVGCAGAIGAAVIGFVA